MHSLEYSSIAQTEVIQVPADRNSTPSTPLQQQGSMVLIPLCFIAIWVGLIYVIADTWKYNQKSTRMSRELARLPCKKCQFFSNNHYIKCAVNPHVVMTPAANDCSDYCAKRNNR